MQTLRCSCIVPCNGRHAPRFTEHEIVTKVGVYRVHRCAQRHDACGVRGQTWPCSRPVAADQSCRCTCASLARHMCTRHTPTFAHYELVLTNLGIQGPGAHTNHVLMRRCAVAMGRIAAPTDTHATLTLQCAQPTIQPCTRWPSARFSTRCVPLSFRKTRLCCGTSYGRRSSRFRTTRRQR